MLVVLVMSRFTIMCMFLVPMGHVISYMYEPSGIMVMNCIVALCKIMRITYN